MLLRLFLDSADLRLAHRAAHALVDRFGRQVVAGAEVRRGKAAVHVKLSEDGPPLWRLLEQVRVEAASMGAAVVESELEGDVPLSALLSVARHALLLRELPPVRGCLPAPNKAGTGRVDDKVETQ